MKETWLPIIINGETSNYVVSDFANVKSVITGNILKENGKSYRYVHLSHNGVKINASVHRLVAIAFIPNPENKPEVNHLDGNKRKNWVSNLEWSTEKENIEHALIHGLIKIGEQSASSKLKDLQVHEICQLLADGVKNKKIAKKLKVPVSAVRDIYYGNTWKQISSLYSFEKFHSKASTIRDAIETGITNPDLLLRFLGWPDTPKNRRHIASVKHDMLHPHYMPKRKSKVLCSSIIPSAGNIPIIEESLRFAWECNQQEE